MGTSSSGPAAPTAYNHLKARAFADCAYVARCAATRGSPHPTEQACRDAFLDANRISLLATGRTQEEATNADYLDVDPSLTQACESAYQAQACNAELGVQCAELRPRNAAQLGEACGAVAGGKSCDPITPSFCSGPDPACTVCEAAPAQPPPQCTADADCPNMHCELGQCLRARKPTVGQQCTPGNCLGNLACVFSAGAFSCVAPVAPGGTCGSGRTCQSGTFCQNMNGVQQCVARAPDGTACARTGGTVCLHECVFPTPTATMGTCQASTQAPAAGGACIGTFCGSNLASFTVANGAITACVCVAHKAAGEACQSGSECASSICLNSTQTCAGTTAGQDGDACTQGSECASLVCELRDGDSQTRCAPAACMPAAVDCGSGNPNGTQGTALALPASTSVGGTTCGMGAYYRVAGPLAADASFAITLSLDDQGPSTLARVNPFVEVGGTLIPVQNQQQCLALTSEPRTCSIITGAGDALVLQVVQTEATPLRFHILQESIRSGGGVCDPVPSNRSQAQAVVLPANGDPVTALFCSLSVAEEFYWEAVGPFPASSVLTFHAVGAASLDVNVVTGMPGSEVTLANCMLAPAFQDCVVPLTQGAQNVFLRTRRNPFLNDRQEFQLSYSVTQ